MSEVPRDHSNVNDLPAYGVGFLLSQLGSHSHRLWEQRLQPLGIGSRQAAMLRHLAVQEGTSQQSLGRALRIPPSRMVALVDDLEHRGLLNRRSSPTDRRVYELRLTSAAREILDKLADVSAQHEAQLSFGLAPQQRDQLVTLLRLTAAHQGLIAGVHPGLSGSGADTDV